MASQTMGSATAFIRRPAACWSVVAPLLELAGNEVEFCDRLQRGELCPELLGFEDPAIAERVSRHPALLWKAEHAREHSRRKR